MSIPADYRRKVETWITLTLLLATIERVRSGAKEESAEETRLRDIRERLAAHYARMDARRDLETPPVHAGKIKKGQQRIRIYAGGRVIDWIVSEHRDVWMVPAPVAAHYWIADGAPMPEAPVTLMATFQRFTETPHGTIAEYEAH